MAKTKTKKQSQRHRIPIYRRPWFIVLILVIILAIIAYLILHSKTPATTNPLSSPTVPASSVDNPSTTVPTGETSATGTEVEDEPEKAVQFEGEDPNTMDSLTGSITRSSVSGANLTIVAVIDQYLTKPGFCTLTIKNSAGDRVYTASRDAVADVTTSICEDFVVSTAGFPAGKYQIEITVSGDGKEGKINGEVNL